jgi:hypothetical protein
MEQKKKYIFLLMAGLVIIAAFLRLIDHPANVSPIMAIAIFSGAYFSEKRFALLIPISAMLISDAFLGYYIISIFVYLAFVFGIFIGYLIKTKVKIQNVFIASLSGSVIFFIITNFGSWLTDPMYQPLTLDSLIRCYYLAIPFFRNTLLGDLAYITAIFGSYALAGRYLPVVQKNS